MLKYDEEYFYKFGSHNDNIGTTIRNLGLLAAGKNILISPCGYGQIVKFTSDYFNNNNIYGLDISRIQTGMRNHKNVICGDMLNIPFKDDYFDLILCADLLEHYDLKDIYKCLDEIERVSSIKGKLILRVGTSSLDDFFADSTHLTCKDDRWWIKIVEENTSFKPIMFSSVIGEYVFFKDNITLNKKLKTKIDLSKYKIGENFSFLKNKILYKRKDGRIFYEFNAEGGLSKSYISLKVDMNGELELYLLDNGKKFEFFQNKEIIMMDKIGE